MYLLLQIDKKINIKADSPQGMFYRSIHQTDATHQTWENSLETVRTHTQIPFGEITDPAENPTMEAGHINLIQTNIRH